MYKKQIDKTRLDGKKKMCRSLICDENGIIIGEMVYRCLICSHINETVTGARDHYQSKHVNPNESLNGDMVFEYPPRNPGDSLSISPAASVNDDGHESEEKPYMQESESGTSITITSSAPKETSAYLHCTICGMARFQSSVQRRYGQKMCAVCYRCFKDFLSKPKIYVCPSLGTCALNVRNRCKACWIKKCIDVYSGKFDSERETKMRKYCPVKKTMKDESPEADENHTETVENGKTSKAEGSDDNLNDTNEESSDTHKFSSIKSIVLKRKGKLRKNADCLQCDNCMAEDCGDCLPCLNKIKGNVSLDQQEPCLQRRCLQRSDDANKSTTD